MSYSPSALNAAMTKSLKFENINGDIELISGTVYKLCTIENNSIYKLNISGSGENNFIIIAEILGTSIPYINSFSNEEIKSTFNLWIEDDKDDTTKKAVYIKLLNNNITNLDLDVEYSFENFILNFKEFTSFISNFTLKEYTFGEQYFEELRAGAIKVVNDFKINTIAATSLEINNIKLGNWTFSKAIDPDGTGNKILLTYDAASEEATT